MTTGEKVSVVLSVAVLVLLLVGGWLASRWRAETRADLRQIAEATERRSVEPMSRTTEWTTPFGKIERFTSYREGRESFALFKTRHDIAVKDLGGE